MRALNYILVFLLNSLLVSAQIATEGFENNTYFSMSSTGNNSGYITGNSAAGDRPATSPFATVGTYAYGVSNGTTTMISETYDTRCYTSVTLSVRLAAFSIGSTANGMEASDNVVVSVSTDGGVSYTTILTVTGAPTNNAYWSYAGGTGVATTVYPTAASFAPVGSGNRTADGYSTLQITSLPNTATLVIKIVALNNDVKELWAIDDFNITGTANTGATKPTQATGITFTQVACNAFLVSWTNGSGNSDLVAVKSGSAVTGTPTDGIGYTVTNSNGALFGIGSTLNAGEYVVYNSGGSSVLVYGLNPSTTYYVSIWESNCFKYKPVPLTGNVTTDACNYCPQMNSVLVDGCNVTCTNEGQTEMAFFNSGSYTIPVNINAVGYNFDQVVNPPTQSYAETIVANPGAITAMNTAGGCGSLFIDASTVGYIPTYSTFLILTSAFCAADYNFSNLCPLAPIYVMFTTSQNWNTSGNYTNNSCPPSPNNKYFFTDFSEAGITCVHYYYYDACLITGGNGGYVTYPSPQTTNTTPAATLAPDVYGNGSTCTLPIALPLNLLVFRAEKIALSSSRIQFTTSSEKNVKKYSISKSFDAIKYTGIDAISAKNNLQQNTYFANDNFENANATIIYYRLEEEDFNGEKKIIGNCFIELKPSKEILINNSETEIVVTAPHPLKSIELYSLDGKNIVSVEGNEIELNFHINLTGISKGFYLLKITDINEKITIKKIIH